MSQQNKVNSNLTLTCVLKSIALTIFLYNLNLLNDIND